MIGDKMYEKMRIEMVSTEFDYENLSFGERGCSSKETIRLTEAINNG